MIVVHTTGPKDIPQRRGLVSDTVPCASESRDPVLDSESRGPVPGSETLPLAKRPKAKMTHSENWPK